MLAFSYSESRGRFPNTVFIAFANHSLGIQIVPVVSNLVNCYNLIEAVVNSHFSCLNFVQIDTDN